MTIDLQRVLILCSTLLLLFINYGECTPASFSEAGRLPNDDGLPARSSPQSGPNSLMIEDNSTHRKPLATKVMRLSDDPDCSEDFRSLCGKDISNNFSILECIQNKGVGIFIGILIAQNACKLIITVLPFIACNFNNVQNKCKYFSNGRK